MQVQTQSITQNSHSRIKEHLSLQYWCLYQLTFFALPTSLLSWLLAWNNDADNFLGQIVVSAFIPYQLGYYHATKK